MANSAGMSLKSLLKIFNVTNPINTSNLPSNLNTLTRYTSNELDKIFPAEIVPAKHPNAVLSAANVLMYTRASQENITKVKYESESILKLAPEIRKARHILTSSILSPNDLQTGALKFSVNVSDLSQDKCDKIANILFEYFNTEFKIMNKLSKYIGESLFGSGAAPVLILPHKSLQSLIKEAKILVTEENLNLNHITLESIASNVANTQIFPRKSTTIKTSIKEKKTTKNNSCITITKNTFIACESLINAYNDEINKKRSSIANNAQIKTPTNLNKAECLISLENVTEKFMKDLESGDFVKFTDNPEIIRIGEDVIAQKKKNMKNNMEKYLFDSSSYKAEQAFSLIDKEEKNTLGHPLYIELSSEACIPICIPGNKEKHLGYFIICDENGYPITLSNTLYNNYYDSGGINQSITAMYGSNSPFDLLRNIDQGRYDIAKTMASTVFSQVLDIYIKDHLSDIGIDGVLVNKIDAISACMFHRLLAKKKTQILFVPESLITYYCFDYREDGTGKNKIEDIMWILSLRTTFLVSALMAMAKEAVDQKQISLTFAEQTENIEQFIEQVAYAFIEKHRMRFNVNPNEISRDIASQALSINYNGIPGLNNLEISDPETKQTSNNKADPELLDRLNDLVKDYLGIPKSILDKVGEDEEFATSIVSKNLFFSKEILTYQSILTEHNDKMIKNYVLHSHKLKNAILNIVNDKLNIDNVKLDDGSVISDENTFKLYKKIVDGINTYLPTPLVSVDKAQFTEIKEYIESISTLVDAQYPNELIANVSEDATNALELLKAKIKTELLRIFMKRLSITANLDIPNLDDIELSSITDVMQTCHNYGLGIKQRKEVILAPENNDDNDFENDSTLDNNDSTDIEFKF